MSVFPRDPFFVVNSVSTVAFALAFLAYFRPVLGAIPTMIAFLIGLLVPVRLDVPYEAMFPVWLQLAIPWNTVPVAALLMMVLVLVGELRESDAWRNDAVIGLLAASVVAVRPGDAVALIPAAALYLRRRVLQAHAFTNVSAAGIAAAVVLGLYGSLSWAIYGGLATPYHGAVRAVGASLSDFDERAYAVLIDAAATHEEPRAALAALQPWLPLAMSLAVGWAIIDVRRGLLAVATAAASLISYISYNDFWPYALWRVYLVHYVVWTLPVLTASGIAGAIVMIGRKRWRTATGALVSAGLLTALQLVPTPAKTAQVSIERQSGGNTRYEIAFERPHEVDAIDLIGTTTRDSLGVTMKSFDVTQDGRSLAVISGYRALQLRRGLRIVFNTHVTATRLGFTLDNSVSNHPLDSVAVRALTFEWTVAPFSSGSAH